MKCPKCDKPLLQVVIKEIIGSVPLGKQWKCIAHSCPVCQTPISIQIDPIAIKADILQGVEALLKQHR